MKRFFVLCLTLCLLFCTGCGSAPAASAAGSSALLSSASSASSEADGSHALPEESAASSGAPAHSTETEKAEEPPAQSAISAASTSGSASQSGGSSSKAPASTAGKPAASPTCTLEIRCDTLVACLDDLDKAVADLVPADGTLYAQTTLSFTEGESVFDVLERTLRQEGMHLEFVETPLYQSAYIEGIGNLYEFDGGPLSGWVYSVNGEFPNYGCSRYSLQDGDAIVWRYTCDLGADVGGDNGAWS